MQNKVQMKNPPKEESLTIWPQNNRLLRCCGSHNCFYFSVLFVVVNKREDFVFSNLSFPQKSA